MLPCTQRGFARSFLKAQMAKSEDPTSFKPTPGMTFKQQVKRHRQLRKQYAVEPKITFSQVMLGLNPSQLKKRREHLKNKFGFTYTEQRYITRQKPNFLLYDKVEEKSVEGIYAVLTDQQGFDREFVRTLILKHPSILNVSQGQLEHYFYYMKSSKKIDAKAAMKMAFEVPLLLQIDLTVKAKEIEDLFMLYHKIDRQQVTEIALAFPYLYCCDPTKITAFLAQFRKYRLSNEQILHLCKNSGGLLGCKPQNFVGLFDYLRVYHKLNASEVIAILDEFPEMALQNRQDIMKRKFSLIRKTKDGLSDIYLKNLFKRHPDMLMKSLGSMQAKVDYFQRNLNRQLRKEKAFPLMLHYNFSKHIWPRCEVLRDFGVKGYNLVDALSTTDEQFCKIFDIQPKLLTQKKARKPLMEEKDYLWVYGTAEP